MQHETVDAKTGQQALELALRLQAENGPRISLEELNRTADEAGIDRAYVASALQQLSPQVNVSTPHQRSIGRIAVTSGLAAAIVALAIASGRPHGDRLESILVVFALASFAGFLVRIVARNGRKLPRNRSLLR